jgi:hypothetical protein
MNSILCTSYAAPIAFYKAIAKSETIWLEKHEHFIKQSVRNRCEIATSNGRLILTAPLSARKNNMPIHEVQLCYKTNWQNQHIKSLTTAYQSSPFFEYFIDDLKKIYALKPHLLIEWNQLIHEQIMKWLKLNAIIQSTLTYQKVYEDTLDYRAEIWSNETIQTYHQVFENKHGFLKNLSIYDLLFNCGNQSTQILNS